MGTERERLTIKLPRAVMKSLRRLAEKQNMTQKEYAEISVTEMFNADIDN